MLKLASSGRLACTRDGGFEIPESRLPLKVLNDFRAKGPDPGPRLRPWPVPFTASNRMETDGAMDAPCNTVTLTITPPLLALLSELDEFKGAWRARGEKLQTFPPSNACSRH